jgi:hypothetical protein
MLGLRRNGVNHVGMENSFRHQVDPGWPQGFAEPVRGKTYPVTATGLLDFYAISQGMRSARVVVAWESLQKNPDPLPRPFIAAAMGAVPHSTTGGFRDYWTDLVQLVIRLIDRGIYVTVGLYQYNKFANNGSGDTDITYNDNPFDKEHFADFWGKFATAINESVTAGFPPDIEFPANPARRDKLAFDLINEPHAPRPDGTVGIVIANWVDCAKAAIQAIRANATNTNTIFVEGMGYGSPNRDTHRINPPNPQLLWEAVRPSDPLNRIAISAHCYDGVQILPGNTTNVTKAKDALATACKDLLDWARQHDFKVHIGEVAVDAGVGGCGTPATAVGQWDDWSKFCVQNDDVLVGWNWWGNTSQSWGWADEGSCKVGDPNNPGSRNWALTQDDGTTSSPHMTLIKNSIPVPELVIRDNDLDTGTEPNATTMRAWESHDIWVRQADDPTPDNIAGDGVIDEGKACVVHVRVKNRGEGDYPVKQDVVVPADGNDVVTVYWAKGGTGLSVPEPWNGKVKGVVPTPLPGGLVGSQPVGLIAAKEDKVIKIAWPTPPEPTAYPVKDGHFCLVAVIAKDFVPRAEFEYEGFVPGNLDASVLNLNNVAWHNIHISSPLAGGAAGGMMRLGAAVLANYTNEPMRAQLALDLLDRFGKRVDPRPGSIRITLGGVSFEQIREFEGAPDLWENAGHGTFAVLDARRATPELTLQSGESLPFVLSYSPDPPAPGYAVRAIQFAQSGILKGLVGGQTFVVGEVEGFTPRRAARGKGSMWLWVIALATLLLIAAVVWQAA